MKLNNRQKVFLLVTGYACYHTNENIRDSHDNVYLTDFVESKYNNYSTGIYKCNILAPHIVNQERIQYIKENYQTEYSLTEIDIEQIVSLVDAEQFATSAMDNIKTSNLKVNFDITEIRKNLLAALA